PSLLPPSTPVSPDSVRRRREGEKLLQNSTDSTSPIAPPIIRMIPTVLMLNPGVLTPPAKVRIAPMTNRKMLAPMLIALPPWTRRGDGWRRPRRRDRYGPAPWVPARGVAHTSRFSRRPGRASGPLRGRPLRWGAAPAPAWGDPRLPNAAPPPRPPPRRRGRPAPPPPPPA